MIREKRRRYLKKVNKTRPGEIFIHIIPGASGRRGGLKTVEGTEKRGVGRVSGKKITITNRWEAFSRPPKSHPRRLRGGKEGARL